jgi:enoyl-CoA hydratase
MNNLTVAIDGDGIGWITLDDGKANVMSMAMLEALEGALEHTAGNARVTVLRGRPGILSAGFDLKTLQRGEQATRDMLDAGIRIIRRMLDHPHPIVTGCSGHAYPMGAFLLLSSDVRIGVEGNWRIGLNEVAVGLTLPHFALALARYRLSASGLARIATATMFSPKEAVAAGYLDRVVAENDLADACRDTALALTTLHLEAYVATKHRLTALVREAIETAPQY